MTSQTSAGTSSPLELLHLESAELEEILRKADPSDWSRETPAAGWTIAHQVAHLAWTDRAALDSLTNPEKFKELLEAGRSDPDIVDRTAEEGAAQEPVTLLEQWAQSRAELASALSAADPQERFPWFGPPMKARSMITARAMETWAHGQDIRDTLGITRDNSPVLQDVAHLGVITRDFAYKINKVEAPDAPFRIELAAPDGDIWTWGPEDADNRVTGPAVDFCLAVTQRRELLNLSLEISGDEAARWMDFAQAFAGPPKSTVRAGQNTRSN